MIVCNNDDDGGGGGGGSSDGICFVYFFLATDLVAVMFTSFAWAAKWNERGRRV